jgi:DNA repair exonuclease SbcCD nuclease subunit
LGVSGDGRQPIRAGEFHPDSTGLATVAAVYGEADASLASRGIDYWALGGRHDRQTVGRDVSVAGAANRNIPGIIHYSGSPQGRRPSESGVHGCTLVQVDELNHLRTNLIPCDAARWLAERVVIEPTTTREDLEARLRDRLRLLHESTEAAKKVELVSTETTMESPATLAFPQPGATATPAVRRPGQTELLVSWMLIGEGPLSRELRRGRLAGELLDGLRGEFGFNSPVAWSVGIETEPTDAFPREWLEQETIRGDFLRAIGELKLNAGESLELENYLSETHRSGSLASAALLEGPERRRVLEEAALLGVELLGGDGEN